MGATRRMEKGGERCEYGMWQSEHRSAPVKLPVFLKLTNKDFSAAWFVVNADATPDGIRVVRTVIGAIISLSIVALRVRDVAGQAPLHPWGIMPSKWEQIVFSNCRDFAPQAAGFRRAPLQIKGLKKEI